ncbi:MAG: PIG-L family deacetylase [Nitrososphaerales archaeon]|nr:PIG-L family deacetylase [Nitrososphaerales archaeon]
MAQRRLMLVFPHPDDESFGPGGTIAKYAREGAAVHYVCATRGEVGTVDAALLKPYEHLPEDQRLGALRGQELRCAADVLGLTGLHYLGYRDSGMAGSPDNQHSRAFINADPAEVVGQLVKLIRSIRPQVIVTFDPFGGYGHPDHIFIHHRTHEAFAAAGDARRYPEAGEPYQPQKLYWTIFPRGLLKFFVRVLPLFGRDPSKFGRNGDINLREITAHDYAPTTRIDVWPYYGIKQQASQCHTSQLSGGPGMFGRWPRFVQRRLNGYELFRRVEPAPDEERLKERDLFEGLQMVD